MPDDQKPMFEADKESRSVNQTADAAKPDAGGSEDRQHENPCPELAQPCGHPASAVASSDEGTAYCAMCEAEQPTCGIAGCVGKHHPQDHNAIFDTSTDDQSRSLFHSLQDALRERNALRAELEHVRRERNTIHDWYVDAKTENVRLRAEVERMRPVVEAALHMRDWQEQDDPLQLKYPGVVDAVTDAANEYRKDTNDE